MDKDAIIDRDEVLKMARQVRLMSEYDETSPWVEGHEITQYVEAFAKLIYDRGWMNGYTSCDNDNKTLTSALIADAVEEEREACAKVCDETSKAGSNVAYVLAREIRARSVATSRGKAT